MLPDPSLQKYHDLLLKWQKTINLVSPATLANVWERHFLDSLQIAKYIPSSVTRLCDIGSGAGFPGLVIAINRKDLAVSLIEADSRKCAFLQTVSRETECKNVTIYNARIEDVIADMDAEYMTSRALASLRQLIRYAEPLWLGKPEFTMVLPKGANFQSEIDEASKHYSFTCHQEKSETDAKGRILIVNNIHPLKA